jgi:hypothetical protein
MLRTVLAVLACGTLVPGCASWDPLLLGRARHYVPIAEGLTAATLLEGTRVAPRMFTAPELVQACGAARPVMRLRVAPDRLDLGVDERFPLARLSVVAINGADLVVPAVPVVFEAEDVLPAVLQLRSDDPDLNEGRIHSVAAGRFRIRVRTLCGTAGAEAAIRGSVR